MSNIIYIHQQLEISIFRFDPCQKYKRGGQIAGKPKGGPLEEKNIFFKKVLRFEQE